MAVHWSRGSKTSGVRCWESSSTKTLSKAFKCYPCRWVVERTSGWLGCYRRWSKDYEELPETSEALIYAAMTHLMVRRECCQPVTEFFDML